MTWRSTRLPWLTSDQRFQIFLELCRVIFLYMGFFGFWTQILGKFNNLESKFIAYDPSMKIDPRIKFKSKINK